MADRKTKLELTWIGKENRPRLEPRILLEDPALSYAAKTRVSEDDIFDNMLIQGDNLLALKALEQEFSGRVRCVFIDPPYNTGSAFLHYDDGIEHSLWMTLIRDRIEMIHRLLADNGTLWISLDDTEAHYLKVLADEVFGRQNFVANVIWQKKYAKQNDAKWLSTSHDHVLVYAKHKDTWRPNQIQRAGDQLKGYSNPDNDPRGPWQSVVYTCAKTRAERPNLYYPITHPRTGAQVLPSESRVWGYDRARHEQHTREGRVWWGQHQEKDKPRLKSYLREVGEGIVPDTLWLRSEVGDNQDAKREALAFNREETFSTPKPEKLVQRVIEIASSPGDLVLDSFLGSGTTAAVAHKTGRRWIGVEVGDHAVTHCAPRLRKVIDGEDPGGVTESVGWQGGGGFRFYRLAPSLLERDKWGNWVINRSYNKEMLAEAMCKLHGFTYAPSDAVFWMHGQSTERDYIYVTTQTLTFEQLQALSEEVGAERSLLVCCGAWLGKPDALSNLTVAKIPASVLERCEWGKDDYSLNVANLMGEAAEPPDPAPSPPGGAEEAPAKKRGRKPKSVQEMPLFAPRGEK
jgi:adenine-specific DNA-methyltransferase